MNERVALLTLIWDFAIADEGQLYCCSKSLGAKLPCRLLLAPVFVVITECVSSYARVNTNLAACNVNTSEPDGAGLCRESGYEERAESHDDDSERCCDPVSFEG